MDSVQRQSHIPSRASLRLLQLLRSKLQHLFLAPHFRKILGEWLHALMDCRRGCRRCLLTNRGECTIDDRAHGSAVRALSVSCRVRHPRIGCTPKVWLYVQWRGLHRQCRWQRRGKLGQWRVGEHCWGASVHVFHCDDMCSGWLLRWLKISQRLNPAEDARRCAEIGIPRSPLNRIRLILGSKTSQKTGIGFRPLLVLKRLSETLPCIGRKD